ncbi:MAG TPA: MFS transporter [Gaiellaceae bacterium]|nr:MFS transporter [Gaiellaceae bacterium]
MSPARRALVTSALGAGVSYSNLAVALPLLVLAERGSALLAGALLAANTVAFSLGALLALALRRPEAGIGAGLAAIAAGDLVLLASPAHAALAVGALAQGIGMGLFWVGVQASLGRRSGAARSQLAFVGQYVVYVGGSAAGAALTGAAIAALRALGVGHAASIRGSFAIGAASALLALPAAVSWLRGTEHEPVVRRRPQPFRGFALQLPDLLLVAAMGMLLNLAPVVLDHEFRFTPLAVGLVSGAIAAAKIAGSVTAGRLTHAAGSRRTVGSMLGCGALAAAALAATHQAWVYVVLTVAAAFLAIGVWPVVVDGALARVSPEERHGLSVMWNVREYAAIAGATALGGYLLDVSDRPTLLLVLVTAFLAAAAASALVVLARPVYAPRAA